MLGLLSDKIPELERKTYNLGCVSQRVTGLKKAEYYLKGGRRWLSHKSATGFNQGAPARKKLADCRYVMATPTAIGQL